MSVHTAQPFTKAIIDGKSDDGAQLNTAVVQVLAAFDEESNVWTEHDECSETMKGCQLDHYCHVNDISGFNVETTWILFPK